MFLCVCELSIRVCSERTCGWTLSVRTSYSHFTQHTPCSTSHTRHFAAIPHVQLYTLHKPHYILYTSLLHSTRLNLHQLSWSTNATWWLLCTSKKWKLLLERWTGKQRYGIWVSLLCMSSLRNLPHNLLLNPVEYNGLFCSGIIMQWVVLFCVIITPTVQDPSYLPRPFLTFWVWRFSLSFFSSPRLLKSRVMRK